MSREFNIGYGQIETWPKITSAPSMGLTFDDVYIAPGNNYDDEGLISLESRKDPDLSVEFGPWTLKTPIITAPMDTVSDTEMIVRIAELGGIGTLYRHKNQADMLEKAKNLVIRDIPFVAAIGLKEAYENARLLHKIGVKMILIDIANGGLRGIPQAAQAISESFHIPVIAGNIATNKQAQAYKNHQVPWARVGIGPGAVCKTRVQTGVGVPQLSAIFDTSIEGVSVIADGGIRKPGDVARSLAAGAKMVMIGSLFAGTEEAPGEIIELDDKQFKRYRGQASASYMEDHGISLDGFRTDEGVDVIIPYKGPVDRVVNEITGGLRSSMLYVGARNLEEYYNKTQFILTSQAGLNEGNPHILQQGNVFSYQGNGIK